MFLISLKQLAFYTYNKTIIYANLINIVNLVCYYFKQQNP